MVSENITKRRERVAQWMPLTQTDA
jgi:hypothetical protein